MEGRKAISKPSSDFEENNNIPENILRRKIISFVYNIDGDTFRKLRKSKDNAECRRALIECFDTLVNNKHVNSSSKEDE